MKYAALLLIGFALFFSGNKESQARLDPYYVLRGADIDIQRPRILVVLDTSGSMAWR